MPASCSETVTFPTVVNGPAAGDPRTAASVTSMGSGLNQRIRFLLWMQERLLGQVAPVGGIPTPIGSMNLTTGIITLSSHNFAQNDPIRFFVGPSGGSFPANAGEVDIMYVNVIDGSTFGVAATSGGSTLTGWTGSFSGENYAVKVGNPDIFYLDLHKSLDGFLQDVALLDTSNLWTGQQTWSGSGPHFTNTPVLAATTITRAQELRIVNKKTYSDTATSSSAYLTNQAGGVIVGHIPAVSSKVNSAADWFWLEVEIPDGMTLTSVTITTIGVGNANPSNKPNYQIIQYGPNSAETNISALVVDAHTFGAGNFLTNYIATTIPANTSTVVGGAFRYALVVYSPYDGAIGPQLEVDGLSWTASANAISQLG